MGQIPEITRNQYAARHATSKDLPTFTGRPEEWPGFISSFENSTRTCGFTNEENLMRLQRCLKGSALEEVSYGLLLPSSVPEVIETLRQLYGRPEIIVNDLLQRIRGLPMPKYDKLETLIRFSTSVQNFVRVIVATQLNNHLNNPMLLQELLEKLPAQLRIDWALNHPDLSTANLATFSDWLARISRAANMVSHGAGKPSTSSRQNAKANASLFTHQSETDSSLNAKEEEMQSLSIEERWQKVRREKLCRRCFHRTPHASKCSRSTSCGKNGCSYRHHPLLHDDAKESKKTNDSNEQAETSCNTHRPVRRGSVYFRIVPVTLYGKQKSLQTYAFLDEGSSLTMIEQSAAAELGLDGTPERLCLKWTADVFREEEESRRVSLKISSREKDHAYPLLDVRTVKNLNLPVQTISKAELTLKHPHLRDVPFLDFENAVPRILIGIDHWKLSIPSEVREGTWDEPAATKTRLGWIVHGQRQTRQSSNVHQHLHVCNCYPDAVLHDQVKAFFSLENFGVRAPEMALESSDMKRARKIMNSTTVRSGNRYETGLIWKFDEVKFPDSFHMASRRFMCLESKMSKDSTLAKKLHELIDGYQTKGYARKLTRAELEIKYPRTWYLPIFCVTNPNKPEKVRIVWDAAATVKGVSLNSMLLKGPDQLASLPHILYGFRLRAVAVCGDIREMFHQVRVRKEDQQSQRFLWRNRDGCLDTYIMQVMTFGATCSPSSAQYVMTQNAQRFSNTHPRAVKAITDHHYVDDLLDSVDTVEEAIKLAKDIRLIHSQGGFEIRNWISSHAPVVEALHEAECLSKKNLSPNPNCDAEKVLGMWWLTNKDAFTFLVRLDRFDQEILTGRRKPTKREVLRTLMSVFDPLGFLAAFLVYIKILLREIWRASTGWDETISDEHNINWLRWTEQLPEVRKIQIPRCYISRLRPTETRSTELHVFVDASANAFAAVAYLRFQDSIYVECSLVGAKTKVAPQQPMTIPRLELQAALLGARFADYICQGHDVTIDRRVLWSDSRTVLSWLKGVPTAARQFVAFRVGEILELTELKEWRWIPTKQNVADEATKWHRRPDMTMNSRWFNGPPFLLQNEDSWPTDVDIGSEPDYSDTELKTVATHVFVTKPCTVYVENFSQWHRLRRAQAFLLRSAKLIAAKARHLPLPEGPITCEELRMAETDLYRRAQFDEFKDEVVTLMQNAGQLDRRSSLLTFTPYMDEDGVLRVHGRIDAFDGPADIKRPVILPRNHNVTTLVLEHYHQKYHHINNETVVNEVKQKYAIPRLRQVLKRVKSECQRCRIQRAKVTEPMMAPLPPQRLAAFARPFTNVGVDCFGPLTVVVGRRSEKRWGMLFTCLTIRAIHIEIAHSLSADSCIMCVRNFVARRGRPDTILSDNGTNFHGATNELQASLRSAQEDQVSTGIKWIFNPPAAPHMGGCWERLIGSVKKVMGQIMPARHPNDELLRSILMEAENIINSRPLTFVSIDSADQEALTPNHFLLGSSNGEKPPGEFGAENSNLRHAWRRSQALANEFWRRWVKEYLPTLTRRTKWFKNVKDIEAGDLVIVVDGNLPRNEWRKGRVLTTNVGKDGKARSATVQTCSGILTRPVVKLAVLDLTKK